MKWNSEEIRKSASFPLGNKAQINTDSHFRLFELVSRDNHLFRDCEVSGSTGGAWNVIISRYQVKKAKSTEHGWKPFKWLMKMEWNSEEIWKNAPFPLENKAQIDSDSHFRLFELVSRDNHLFRHLPWTRILSKILEGSQLARPCWWKEKIKISPERKYFLKEKYSFSERHGGIGW